jgi:hypothetical protein
MVGTRLRAARFGGPSPPYGFFPLRPPPLTPPRRALGAGGEGNPAAGGWGKNYRSALRGKPIAIISAH